jgi:hypothetical protein
MIKMIPKLEGFSVVIRISNLSTRLAFFPLLLLLLASTRGRKTFFLSHVASSSALRLLFSSPSHRKWQQMNRAQGRGKSYEIAEERNDKKKPGGAHWLTNSTRRFLLSRCLDNFEFGLFVSFLLLPQSAERELKEKREG